MTKAAGTDRKLDRQMNVQTNRWIHKYIEEKEKNIPPMSAPNWLNS